MLSINSTRRKGSQEQLKMPFRNWHLIHHKYILGKTDWTPQIVRAQQGGAHFPDNQALFWLCQNSISRIS